MITSEGLYKTSLDIAGERFLLHDLRGPEKNGMGKLERLPYVLRILLEGSLRHHDGKRVTDAHVNAFAAWDGTGGKGFPFLPSRVILQDFTGVPAVVDLAAMRTSLEEAGGDPARVNPVIPVDLIIDHSVTADCHGTEDALACNVAHEFERNGERYQFLHWAQEAFERFRVFPPSVGIVHQVNLEHLATVITEQPTSEGPLLHPDTLVGTDSHTPMINGIGVLGWGVGGIEAEACMLGLPLEMQMPEVVGVELTGKLEGASTATDLALTVTHLLRKTGVVNCFVEFYGDGLQSITVEDRATVANMAPEYGATTGFFPVDEATLAYLRTTGRSERQITLVEAYTKAQHLFRDPDAPTPLYSRTVRLNLCDVEPGMAGPKRPQDFVPLTALKKALKDATPNDVAPLTIRYDDGTEETLSAGAVVIAAITSCTNTSNPYAMLLAGLLAKKAVALGLRPPHHVKASLAPGSLAVTAYLKDAGLLAPLEQLGFYLAGYGCTTCIGNSGPLVPEVAAALRGSDLPVSAVLSGNRNFEGRVHPQVTLNWLAAPALVVASALAGTVNIDYEHDSLGMGPDNNRIRLRDLWPTAVEVLEATRLHLSADTFLNAYRNIRSANERWNSLSTPEGRKFAWDDTSTYIRRPPFYEEAAAASSDRHQILALLGDTVTTDHISPAGSIPKDVPAGKYLADKGVAQADFNSYGSRRGNHEVMMRGTFANIRIRNQLTPEKEGGWTRHWPSGDVLPIYDACQRYKETRTPLVVIAGSEYGTGSSRDWAAKGTTLLGIRVVLARSYERIHRSNLVGMGVLPLQFLEGEHAGTLGLDGSEILVIPSLPAEAQPGSLLRIELARADGSTTTFSAKIRLDSASEINTWQRGGLLRQVLGDF